MVHHRNIKNLLIAATSVMVLASCNRTTTPEKQGSDAISSEAITPGAIDPTVISAEEPFKNQPSEFCTVIRKLDISFYAPNKSVDDVSAFPKKYCLLDICLEQPGSSGMVVNLGDETEIVTADFELIKVFESSDEAKAYAEKYKIIDAVFEE